ncbi:MAG: CRISPR-associated helicase Cas3' [Lentisphaeria bacterium]|nr:CRISPR-associated helicase Cas3' [Lentisphaeria bacterium]
MSIPLAHVSEDHLRAQPLKDHAAGTAGFALAFAKPIGAEIAAQAVGMLHDIGKASDAFQKRLKGAIIRVDHSTAGAIEAIRLYHDPLLAACIAGHHAGLPDFGTRQTALYGDGTLYGRLKAEIGAEGDIERYDGYRDVITPIPPTAVRHPNWVRDPYSVFSYIHFLYSCLVDADFLDTEAFMKSSPADRGQYEDLKTLERKLDPFLENKQNPTSELNRKRTEILNSLIAASAYAPGLYTLTVPTGGGKTLSSMAFALKHALRHGMERIIYVIPYQSIIEQTAKVFSDIFGEENVLAHYSNADFYSDDSEISNRKKLSAENWDAPIIVTTSVQFFESFFSHKSSKCRKLHNVAQSVLIFDEAQALPTDVLRPCLLTISELVKHYGCTAVLCTATQPALNRIFNDPPFLPGVPVEELCPDTEALYEFFRRVRYRQEGNLSADALAERLLREEQVLCILNTKKSAAELFDILTGEGTYCLTTGLTPRGRRRQLDEIRARLAEELPCRVISTSLIEAGVDVDFPSVWREMAGLDSVIQAGGRCNRENRRAAEDSVVHIFSREDSAPPRYIRKNVSAAQIALAAGGDLDSPDTVRDYFNRLLYVLKDDTALDRGDFMKKMTLQSFPLKEIGESFKVIDEDQCAVLVPCPENRETIDELRRCGVNRRLLRKLGADTVSLRRSDYLALRGAGCLEEIAGNLSILAKADLYDPRVGLKTEADLIF